MNGRRSWAVVKDSLTTPARSGHQPTVKQSLTVRVVPGPAPTTEISSAVQDCQPGMIGRQIEVLPIRDAVRRELSWTHYRLPSRTGSKAAP